MNENNNNNITNEVDKNTDKNNNLNTDANTTNTNQTIHPTPKEVGFPHVCCKKDMEWAHAIVGDGDDDD